MLKITRLKLIVQIILAAAITYLGYLGVRMIEWNKIGLVLPTLSCHYLTERIASCYLFTIQNLFNAGWKEQYRNIIVPTILFAALGLIAGRAWCAWACPVGLLQDMFSQARKSLHIGHYRLSDGLERAANVSKWFLALSLVFISIGIGIPHFFLKAYRYDLVLPFCQICPGKQLFPLFTGRFDQILKVDTISTLTAVMSYLAIASFTFYVVTTAFIRRMWCKLCPMGVFLGFLNKISLLSLRKEGKRCTKCGICLRACPVPVKEVYEEKKKERIAPSDCILCFRCVEMCPEKDALKIGFLKKAIARSTYKRFLSSNDVKTNDCKRMNVSGEKQVAELDDSSFNLQKDITIERDESNQLQEDKKL